MSKHSGKDQTEFKFVLSFYKVEKVAKLPSGTSGIQVEWTRGGSKGSSPRAAVTSDTANWNSGANTIEVISNLFNDPGSSTFDEKTLILIPSSLNKFMPKTNKNLNISFWDKITDFTKIISLSESLKFIEKVDGKLDYDSIYFTVNGIEDEGVLLDQFLEKEHRAKMFPVIKDLLDLYDLRCFNSNYNQII